jgi:O-glycosyl hydrolase
MKTPHRFLVVSFLVLGLGNAGVLAQVECSTPGNIRGIRVDGELMAFNATVRAVVSAQDGSGGVRGGAGGGQFSREGSIFTMTGSLSGGGGRGGGPGGGGRGPRGGAPAPGTSYRAAFKDVAPGTVDAEVQITATTNTPMQGVFFALALPSADYAGGSAELIAPVTAPPARILLKPGDSAGTNHYLRASAKGLRVISPRRQIEIDFATPVEFVVQDVRNRGKTDFEVSFPLSLGDLTNGQTVTAKFTMKASGEIDKSPASLAVDLSHPGRQFDGMGGNFRIQSPADAAQIQYNLDNLRVAWGRVAMPFDRWQPDENADPVAAATAGQLDANVREAMAMAQKLGQKEIPFVISVWQAPAWALATTNGARGGRARINPGQWDKVCQSIGSYIEYLKKNFDAEPSLFSFNESDMGINVLQSPQEHDDAIKHLGSYFAAHGLKTRLLLGDTGNPTGDKFIDVAVADPEAAKYIGAVSFHSWNSGTIAQYTHFADAAKKLNVPLLVCEGGLDPAAHQYRAIFLEPWFDITEIAQYVEICRVAQPLSILHWQFTADYSVLKGGGGGQPLGPAPRFWQIKQLGMTAPGAVSVPVTCDNPKVVSCAFADRGACVVHLVNNGAARSATVSGLPAAVKEVRVLVTDNRRGMEETGRVPVAQGRVRLPLDAMSFTSLVGSER